MLSFQGVIPDFTEKDIPLIPVHRDAAEVEYAGCGEIDVKAVPNVAHEGPKQPAARDFYGGIECHSTQSLKFN